MVEATHKIVSIESFRAGRRPAHTADAAAPGSAGARAALTDRNIEHRERMLTFLRKEAREAQQARRYHGRVQEVQGRLLL